MNRKFIGIILIVIGIALIAWGYSVYDSAGSKISRLFTGDTPIEAWIGLVGGTLCTIAGIFRLK